MKTCTRCCQILPLEMFALRTGTKDGRQWWCKPCTKEVNHAWYEAHVITKAKKAAEWYRIPENREKVLRVSREQHETHREEINARHRQRYAEKKGASRGSAN